MGFFQRIAEIRHTPAEPRPHLDWRFAQRLGVVLQLEGQIQVLNEGLYFFALGADGIRFFSRLGTLRKLLGNRKREYLRNVETIIGLKRGLLSEVEAEDRTATEVTSSEGDYNLTIIDFQQMWENALREAVRLCGVLGQLYHIPGAHEVPDDSVVIDWGNCVLFDEEKTWADYKDMVACSLLKPEIALGWRFNIPADTPAQQEKIRKMYMPDAVEDGE